MRIPDEIRVPAGRRPEPMKPRPKKRSRRRRSKVWVNDGNAANTHHPLTHKPEAE